MFYKSFTTFEDWTAVVDSGYGIDIIYLDYSEAFDTVPHLRLIEKLKGYGISGKLIMWLKSFLNGRLQRVVLNGVQSHWSEVTSGVLQGSVLRPLLLVLYINKLGIFTDDTKIYSIINSVRDVHVEELQCDLDSMREWSRTWLLNLNLEKYKIMHIGKTPNASYSMEISSSPGPLRELSVVNFEKDLGVWTTSTLKPSLHCDIRLLL